MHRRDAGADPSRLRVRGRVAVEDLEGAFQFGGSGGVGSLRERVAGQLRARHRLVDAARRRQPFERRERVAQGAARFVMAAQFAQARA
ncbi:hypothetical protein [Dokdonella fugitiva]|uniref:hypothetical protein n=1 Tax=Dokdonella fugitiva TaxID=328517 RepID=UPI003D189712